MKLDQYDHLAATQSAARTAAHNILLRRLETSEEVRRELIERVLNLSIIDKLVPPASMQFDAEGGFHVTLGNPVPRTIHIHALRQMGGVTGMPLKFIHRLRQGKDWECRLLATNLNTLFSKGEYLDRRKQPTKFLVRLVGDEVRGFLSRNYNRRLNTPNLLRPFLETCALCSATPSLVRNTGVKVVLEAFVPVVFEPLTGEFIAFGAAFSNSDFGQGKMRVAGVCMRIRAGTTSTMSDALSRVHLGSIIQESDLEMSAETEDAELRTHQLAVRDTVEAVLSPENVDKSLKLIQIAAEKEIPWYRLQQTLQKVLQKSEVEMLKKLLEGDADEVVDLPPIQDNKATAWWAANALGWIAQKTEDAERRTAIELASGELWSSDGA